MITIDDLIELLLRFISRPKHYYGTITIKCQNGKLVNIVADDSFDVKYLKEKQIMFTKFGAPNAGDKESSKITEQVDIKQLDEEKIEETDEEKNKNKNKNKLKENING